MKLMDYIKDKILLLVLHAACMAALSVFLLITGNTASAIGLILIFWLLILFIWMTADYIGRRTFFKKAENVLEQVDQRYLLGELLPESVRLEDRLYRSLIRRSNKSVIERLRYMEDEQRQYQEYIEAWVHEIKAPITGISLVCENARGGAPMNAETIQTIAMENRRIENCVDVVLYYARAGAVYKDYLIRRTSLAQIAAQVLAENRLYLIQNHVSAKLQGDAVVYTDEKWIAFILNQMILNSVKYSENAPRLIISMEQTKQGASLVLEDHGTGIPENEISRIFEKGFTGSNGREQKRATGMGLYLCKTLCEKLGIVISARSEVGKGTQMKLFFPVSRLIREARDPMC